VCSSDLDCADGDPCDVDGVVDGRCTFSLAVCALLPDLPPCVPQFVTSFSKNNAGLALPTTPVLAETCADPSFVQVELKKQGRKPGKRCVTVAAVTNGKPKKDTDRVALRCLPGTRTCASNPAGGPSEVTVSALPDGTDLDIGWTGTSQNFPLVPGTRLSLCLGGCDASAQPECQARGLTGVGSPNGVAFGPPLPLVSGG